MLVPWTQATLDSSSIMAVSSNHQCLWKLRTPPWVKLAIKHCGDGRGGAGKEWALLSCMYLHELMHAALQLQSPERKASFPSCIPGRWFHKGTPRLPIKRWKVPMTGASPNENLWSFLNIKKEKSTQLFQNQVSGSRVTSDRPEANSKIWHPHTVRYAGKTSMHST